MKQAILISILFLWTSLYTQSYITVEDAIKIALEYNYDIRIARNDLQIARNTAGYGTAGFLPSVNLSAGESVTRSREESNSLQSFGDSDTRQRAAQISLNWTLFDGFRMFTNKSRFQSLAELGEYQTRNLIESTVVAILRAYFNLVQQQQLLDVAREAVNISATRLQKEEVRQELGSASSTDLLNARVSYNNDREQLIYRELDVSITRRDLNILLGREPDSALEVEREIVLNPVPESVDELMEKAMRRNSTLLVVRQNRKVSDQNVRLAGSAFYPSLFFSGSYGYRDRETSSITNLFSDIRTEGTDAVAGITLSVNLFDGFRDKIDWQNARIEAKSQALFAEDVKHRISGQVQSTYETFRRRLELVDLEMENVTAAEQNLRLQQDRYDIGGTSSLEFRDAQLNYTRARNTLIAARFQARISRLEIEQLTGTLDIGE